MIRGPEELFDSEPRWAGVQRVAAEAGIRFDPRLVFQLPGLVDPISGFEGGVRFAKQMLASGCPFTAVLAFDDLTALGVVRGLIEAGLRVPEDCSVLGFDDVLPAEVATPGDHHYPAAAEGDGVAGGGVGIAGAGGEGTRNRSKAAIALSRRRNW